MNLKNKTIQQLRGFLRRYSVQEDLKNVELIKKAIKEQKTKKKV